MAGYTFSDATRLALRWFLDAVIAAGTVQMGGDPELVTDAGDGRPAPPPRCPRSDRWVEREAARGIAQLELFLAGQPHG